MTSEIDPSLFELLVRNMEDSALLLLDSRGHVLSWNSGAGRILGYAAHEALGRHLSLFYPPGDIGDGEPCFALEHAREEGSSQEQGWCVRKDGSRFRANVRTTALRNETGKLLAFSQEIRELDGGAPRRKKSGRKGFGAVAAPDADLQLGRAGLQEQSARKMSELIAVLAHELRNPLAPIRNAAHRMKMLRLDDKALEETAQILDRQSAQLSQILDDLLDATRITRGTLAIRMAPTSMQAVLTRALESAAPLIQEGDHSLTTNIPSDALTVNGDEIRLAQALTNILNNAARYSEPNGRIHVEVTVSGTAFRDVCIAVRDKGHGIAPSQLDSIFGMFVQGGDGADNASNGLGIGLTIARSLVELHDGTIEARSAGVGKGSEFVICLPLMENPGSRKHALSSQRQGSNPADGNRRQRILVVDDNDDAATMLAALLREWGHEVLSVNSGAQALAAADDFLPQIVLLDLGMPEMDGFAVARRLRERGREPSPLIVAVTGWGAPEDKDRTRKAGFDHHLVKPVEEFQLRELLDGERKPPRQLR